MLFHLGRSHPWGCHLQCWYITSSLPYLSQATSGKMKAHLSPEYNGRDTLSYTHRPLDQLHSSLLVSSASVVLSSLVLGAQLPPSPALLGVHIWLPFALGPDDLCQRGRWWNWLRWIKPLSRSRCSSLQPSSSCRLQLLPCEQSLRFLLHSFFRSHSS